LLAAARLQAEAASGEIIMSQRVHGRTSKATGAEPCEPSLKGKREPEIAMVTHAHHTKPAP
jgi:class 3 adenylate cyclase